jgi:hypothetical protein
VEEETPIEPLKLKTEDSDEKHPKKPSEKSEHSDEDLVENLPEKPSIQFYVPAHDEHESQQSQVLYQPQNDFESHCALRSGTILLDSTYGRHKKTEKRNVPKFVDTSDTFSIQNDSLTKSVDRSQYKHSRSLLTSTGVVGLRSLKTGLSQHRPTLA